MLPQSCRYWLPRHRRGAYRRLPQKILRCSCGGDLRSSASRPWHGSNVTEHSARRLSFTHSNGFDSSPRAGTRSIQAMRFAKRQRGFFAFTLSAQPTRFSLRRRSWAPSGGPHHWKLLRSTIVSPPPHERRGLRSLIWHRPADDGREHTRPQDFGNAKSLPAAELRLERIRPISARTNASTGPIHLLPREHQKQEEPVT